MRYDGFEVYKRYLAVKNHFTTESYDYGKYGGRVTAKLDSFTKRNDRHFFHKLSTKYKEHEIVDYFVCNFLNNSKKWVGDLVRNDGAEEYLKWRKYKESFGYSFRNDCVFVCDDFFSNSLSFDGGLSSSKGQHPRLLKLYLRKKIHIQTLYVLNQILRFDKKWSKDIEEKIIWPDIAKKMKKMRAFISINDTEAKLIMKEVFVNE